MSRSVAAINCVHSLVTDANFSAGKIELKNHREMIDKRDNFNIYHVAPAATQGDGSGRYPRNFVKFPWFLKPLFWGDSLSRLITGKPAYLFKDSLLKIFDSVHAPNERWGSADERGVLRKNLALFGRSNDDNPYISPMGRILIKAMTKVHLENRAATIDFFESNREFIEANGCIKAPLIVTGFPRTGTTLLQRLLSEDPNTRSPYTYELEKSTPPLRTGMDPKQDPRLKKSSASLAALSKMMPGFIEKFSESHVVSPLEKEESLAFMQFHNGMNILNGIGAGREYFRSMNQPDVANALLKYERNFFTMLDAYCPARSHWTLKAPEYAAYFGSIFDHYPDARVVVTHRHPSKNLASVCRFFETWLLPFDMDGSFDKLRFARFVQDEFSAFLTVPMEFRQANPQREAQIADCMYQDLFRDPIAVVKNIYAKFDLEYTPEFERRMKRYLAENQQGKYGRHKYSNAEYGIEPHLLYQQNKTYFDFYGFKPDADSAD